MFLRPWTYSRTKCIYKSCNIMSKLRPIEVKIERKGLAVQMDKEEFALALKTWRLRQGLTQRQVGDMWGVSRFTIMRAESARNVTWETAYRLFAKLAAELQKEGVC